MGHRNRWQTFAQIDVGIARSLATGGNLPMSVGFAELHAASAFSFLEGANQPETMVARARKRTLISSPALTIISDAFFEVNEDHRSLGDSGPHYPGG
jgi:hypothetical protein